MIPTVANVMDAARSHLGDTEIAGGQLWTNAALQTFLNQAYGEMLRAFAQSSIARIYRRSYYNLPANTSYLAPATASITNFGEPAVHSGVAERAVRNTSTVTGAALGAGFVDLTTAAPHAFVAGQIVVVFGVAGLSDDVNDLWSVEVPGATIVRLLGSVATGAWTSGGTVSDSAEEFVDLDAVATIDSWPNAPVAALGRYAWLGDAFRFWPAATVRQIRLTYSLSANAPSTGSLAVDDSRDFLAARAAALAAGSGGARGRAGELNILAMGNPGGLVGEASAGAIGELVRLGVKTMQRNRFVTRRYRPKRNVGPFFPYQY